MLAQNFRRSNLTTYPKLLAAYNMLRAQLSGPPNDVPVEALPSEDYMRSEGERYCGPIDLPRVEQFLATLSPTQFEAFVVFDEDYMAELTALPDGDMANAVVENLAGTT